jgi:hypothetical protein
MTKKDRELCSKKRQTIYLKLTAWKERLVAAENHLILDPSQKAKDQVVFAKKEIKSIREEIFRLERGNLKQRAWNGGGRI